ncbi:MAG: hypothetical protein RI964_204 [Pseudomonadota bacterium]|jgi:L,D-peptidoglycan transpeptidase YkuD (ErfK/YbiS/YcfS/YnhG family)
MIKWYQYFIIALLACGLGLFWSIGYVPNPNTLAKQTLKRLALPNDTTQVLLVTSKDWNASSGALLRLEKQGTAWRVVGNRIPVRLGRNGMAWGMGLHANSSGASAVLKHEGDGKAPAGIFTLGTTFGYAPQVPQGWQMPYHTASERDYFIDALDSPDYNQWCTLQAGQANDPHAYWSSFERMRRDDQRYEYGMVIEHNTHPITVGRGSAIFMHVWLNPETPTSGCTAMVKDDVLSVLAWLKPDAHPLLIQVPADAVGQLRYEQAR